MVGRYRNRLEIIVDVLAVIREGATKTSIMNKANLSYTLLTRYLTDVMDMLLAQQEKGNRYTLTKKGVDFLQELNGCLKRRGEIEEQLQDINDELARVMDRFLNPSVGLEKYRRIQGEEKSGG